MTAVAYPEETPVDRVLAKLSRVRRGGAGKWMARCPVHDDQTASLSVGVGTDGRCVLYCQAECPTPAVVAAIGLTMRDLFPAADGRAPSTAAPAAHATTRQVALVKTYDYTDETGALLYQVCRFVDRQTGKKTFRQRRPDGAGGWIWSLGDVTPVLYRLPDVLAALESGRRVCVVEGEKDADALAAEGYTATTCPMGAGKWREAFAHVLGSGEIVVLPDNDEPGRAHAEQIAASCVAAGATVKVVALPGLPPKGDVSDWLANEGNTLDTLDQLIGEAPRWTGDAVQAAHRTRWRLDELIENDSIMRPPPAIVPRLAWAGRSTLLSAREKAGKSTITGYITACVSNGAEFLGVLCQRGPVLVVGLEEFIGDTARRLRHFDADPTNVHLVDRFLSDGTLRAAELRDHIESVGPLLVIVDSLTTWSNGLGVTDHNDSAQMTSVLQPLTDMVHQLGCALIVIHHTTKGRDDPRGATGITAAVDMVCTFTSPQPEADPTLRRMTSVGRLPVPRVYDIRFSGDTYTLSDSVEAPIEERIVAVVSDRPTCSANDVADVLGGRRQTVLSTIAQMIADGRLRQSGPARAPKLVVPGHPLAEPLL